MPPVPARASVSAFLLPVLSALLGEAPRVAPAALGSPGTAGPAPIDFHSGPHVWAKSGRVRGMLSLTSSVMLAARRATMHTASSMGELS